MEGFQTYEWETTLEQDYRKDLVELSQEIAGALALFEDISKSSDRDYSSLKEVLRKLQRKHQGFAVPSMYEEADSFLAQAIKSYLRGVDIATQAVKVEDSQQLYRAARQIMEGNNFIHIAKNRMWEAVEERQKEAVH